MRQSVSAFLISVTFALTFVDCGLADDSKLSEVIVLSTLHQLHEQTRGYTFQDLSEVIEQLRPDFLAVELTAIDLESRRDQPVKQEYQRSVFPLLDKHHYQPVALEPPQPLYGELVGLFREANKQLSEQNPAAAATFDVYTESLYQILIERWVSPAEVNSLATDILFESKHRFQSAIFGPSEVKAWEQWNQHFLQKILTTAEAHPGKRILVLVGAEHSYWLRSRLDTSDINLRDTARLLDSFTD
jgi:hypothetical protein